MFKLILTSLAAVTAVLITLSEASSQISWNWQKVPGLMASISKGNAGIWGLGNDGKIYKKNPTGDGWTKVDGLLTQISSGSSVWGVNSNHDIFKWNSGGGDWTEVDGKLTNVAVSNRGRVWGVNTQGNIFRRNGNSWQKVTGGAKQVSVGESGVWIVDGANNIFYRTGTFGDADTGGSGWERTDGKLKWISSGTNLVVGVYENDYIYYRTGVSASNPTGTAWVHIPGLTLTQIDIDGKQIIGVKRNYEIYKSEIFVCDCRSVNGETYRLDDVDYDLKQASKNPLPPTNVGKKIVKNRSSQSQTSKYTVSRTISETSSFQHTAGVSVTVGTTFKAKVPLIAEAGISLDVTASYEFSHGTEKTEDKTVSAEFSCTGAAKKVTECDSMLFREMMEVPFTRIWVHKKHSSCSCRDSGIFRKISGHRLVLEIKERDFKTYE